MAGNKIQGLYCCLLGDSNKILLIKKLQVSVKSKTCGQDTCIYTYKKLKSRDGRVCGYRYESIHDAIVSSSDNHTVPQGSEYSRRVSDTAF